MTLNEFVEKNEGKTLDFDGAYGGQCMDLYRYYARDVLGYPQSPPVVGAKDVWDTYLKSHYTRLDNTPDAVTQRGDIIIWGRTYGPFGHIAVSLGGDINGFNAFSQNDPTGEKCVVKRYNYNHVLGWLRPAKAEEPIMDKVDLGGLSTELETYGVIEIGVLKSKLKAKDSAIKGFELSLNKLTSDVQELKEENKVILEKLAKEREATQELNKNREKLEKEIEKLKGNEPLFTNPISKVFYALAKALE